MEKPKFIVYGKLLDQVQDETEEAAFENLQDALGFAEANLEEYAIYMRMKIEEKKRGS